MSGLLILIYTFNTIPVQIPASFFFLCVCVDIDKMILKFIQRDKKPRIADTVVKENRRHYPTSRCTIKLQ